MDTQGIVLRPCGNREQFSSGKFLWDDPRETLMRAVNHIGSRYWFGFLTLEPVLRF